MPQTTTIDIDTAAAPQTLVITDLEQLKEIVHLMAKDQLIITTAETHCQAQVEIIKKAFDEETAAMTAANETRMAAVTAYALANIETLFPKTTKGQKKTYKVLKHALKLTRTHTVVSEPGIVKQIESLITTVSTYPGDTWNDIPKETLITVLKGLIRRPEPELNKDAFKAMVGTEEYKALAEVFRLNGCRVNTADSFTVTFNFSPEEKA